MDPWQIAMDRDTSQLTATHFHDGKEVHADMQLEADGTSWAYCPRCGAQKQIALANSASQ